MNMMSEIKYDILEQFQYRAATAADEDRITDVMRAAIRKSCVKYYGERSVKLWTAPENRIFKFQAPEHAFVAEGEDGIVSVAGWSRQQGMDDVARISAAFTLPEYERMGLGRRLIAMTEDSIRAAGISDIFLFASMNAVPFYRHLGFTERNEELIEVAKDHFVSVLRMSKALA